MLVFRVINHLKGVCDLTDMKVAGRKNMVTAAMVIIDALSSDVCRARTAVMSPKSLLC